MLPRTDVLKLSDEDLGLLYPGIDPAAFAADCLGKGAGLVALTRGGKGAFAWHASGVVEVPPVQVDVIDTVGAGDTFQAALLTRLDELGALSPARRARAWRRDAARRDALRGPGRGDHLLAARRRPAAARGAVARRSGTGLA